MNAPERIRATVSAARKLMVKRLEAPSLDDDARRELERALNELDLMWEELQAQATMLERESERYAEFFEYSPDAYVITEAGGAVREANQAALELLRGARADVVGRPLADWIAAREVQCSVRAIRLKKNGGDGLCWLIRPG